MKTRSIALLMVLLICLGFSACGDDDVPPAPPAESKVQESEPEDSETQEPDEPETLRVVTDKLLFTNNTPCRPRGWPQKALSEMAEHFGGTPNGLNVELQVLPALEDNYEAELTQVRVELMAGKGPDVFLMSGFGGDSLPWEQQPVSTLFLNPEVAMKRNTFLALDDLIADAKLMEPDKLLGAVMDAGKYDGRQYIMPITYCMPAAVTRKTVDEAQLPANWEEGINSDIDDVRWSYAVGAWCFPCFRNIVFGQVADNLNEQLLIDEDELFQRTREACEAYSRYKREAPEDYLNCGAGNMELWLGAWTFDVCQTALVDEEEVPDPFFLMRNSQGGLSAGVETWCAVNANTKHPEDAFFIVELFMTREFQSTDVFWETRNFVTSYPVLNLHGNAAIPVYSELLTKKMGGYLDIDQNTNVEILGKTQREALKEAQANISFAYLTSNIDRELDLMFHELVERIDSGDVPTEDEIRSFVGKCYTAMKMMLAES